jgi:RecB family exonuclease
MKLDKDQKPYLSVSQIQMYLRCPLQYYYRYVEDMKIPPNSAITLGSSVHQGIAFNYRQKKETHKDLKTKEILNYYDNVFNTLKTDTLWKKGEKAGKVKDQGAGLVKIYHKEISPVIQPLEVEEWFEVQFENVDYLFKGIMDLVDEEHRVIDHKTSSRTPNQKDVNKDLQMSGYALGHRVKFGIPEKELRMDFMVKTQQPKVVSLVTQRTQEDIDRFLKTMAFVANAIKNEMFYPCHPGNWQCSPEWCGYYNICHKQWHKK